MYTVISVFNSLSVLERSRYTAACVHSDFPNARYFYLKNIQPIAYRTDFAGVKMLGRE